MEAGIVVIEPAGKHLNLLLRAKRVFAIERSQYQEIVLAEIEGFGRSLLLDKYIQSTEKDEYIYHELLVHPAMALHPHPERVLILGGGEGATLREVLKHSTVKEVVMVDIDSLVVEFSKKYLEHIHQGSFNDPRAKVIIMDGMEYVKEAPNSYFDVVIMDLTDPYAGDLARPLYSERAFKEIRRIMKSNGVLTTQAGSSYFYPEEYKYVLNNVKAVFKFVSEFWFWVPSFGVNVNFIVASDEYKLDGEVSNIDARLKTRGVSVKLVSSRLVEGLLKVGVLYPRY